MKLLFLISVLLFVNTSLAEKTASEKAGLLFNGKSMLEKGVSDHFFNEAKLAEEDGRDLDICYFGYWEKALSGVHNHLIVSIIDIYGESKNPPLEIEITNKEKNDYISTIVRSCGL